MLGTRGERGVQWRGRMSKRSAREAWRGGEPGAGCRVSGRPVQTNECYDSGCACDDAPSQDARRAPLRRCAARITLSLSLLWARLAAGVGNRGREEEAWWKDTLLASGCIKAKAKWASEELISSWLQGYTAAPSAGALTAHRQSPPLPPPATSRNQTAWPGPAQPFDCWPACTRHHSQ